MERKQNQIYLKQGGTSQKLFCYALNIPLKIWEKFTSNIKVSNREEVVKVYVVKGKDQSLLGQETYKKNKTLVFESGFK